MARRPSIEQQRFLNEADIKQLQENLAHLNEGAVKDFYQRAYQDCRMIGQHFPTPVSIQQLVQAWKTLRKWRK